MSSCNLRTCFQKAFFSLKASFFFQLFQMRRGDKRPPREKAPSASKWKSLNFSENADDITLDTGPKTASGQLNAVQPFLMTFKLLSDYQHGPLGYCWWFENKRWQPSGWHHQITFFWITMDWIGMWRSPPRIRTTLTLSIPKGSRHRTKRLWWLMLLFVIIHVFSLGWLSLFALLFKLFI